MELGLVLAVLVQGCAAASAESSGSCGENLTWTLDDNGLLTIRGIGGMYDYSINNLSYDSSAVRE